MNDLLKRITVNPEQCGGRPGMRGRRVHVIFSGLNLAASDAITLIGSGETGYLLTGSRL
jgi:hypothetical protein